MRIQGKLMGGVAWHEHLAVKVDNEKLVVKVGSVQINNHNIFHRLHSPLLVKSAKNRKFNTKISV
jgi:dipeptidase